MLVTCSAISELAGSPETSGIGAGSVPTADGDGVDSPDGDPSEADEEAPESDTEEPPESEEKEEPPESDKPTSTPAPTKRPTAHRGTALFVLAELEVKGRAPKTGYDRDEFGSGWADTDNNSCSTRDDILRRDLRSVTVAAGTGGCEVVTGRLSDPYTGTTIKFRRGATTSDDVQIDHV